MPQKQDEIKRLPEVDIDFRLLTIPSTQVVGDIVSSEKKVDFVQLHEKINVNFQIIKIIKHVSSFEFEKI
jgi:hypothetical protein